jgi:hypothetical protein
MNENPEISDRFQKKVLLSPDPIIENFMFQRNDFVAKV